MKINQNKPLLGIALNLAAVSVFPFLDTVAKILGQQAIPVFEIVWARQLFGLLLLTPLLIATEGTATLIPKSPKLNILRAVFIMLSTLGFFGALRFLGLAETLAIYFIQPLIVTMLAPLMLNETVGIRRWLAVLVGFCGVLIIIRPGFQSINPGVFLALGSGLGSAIALILTRKVSGIASAMATTVHANFYGTVMTSVIVIFFWQTPTWYQIFLFVLLGFFGTVGNYLTLKAFTYAEASLLAPFGYAEMINAVLLGWLVFGDFPDHWTFVGVAILVACAIYISYRERVKTVLEPI
jgi:drug/metabolite transporter (DMT)-like permease